MYKTIRLLLIISITSFPVEILPATLDPDCDHYQYMELGKEYFIYNHDYPAKSKEFCRWTGESPPGTTIVLSCNEVDFPHSTDCQRGKLAFSPYGDEDLDYAEYYCGNASFTAYTYGNRFGMTLVIDSAGTGGKFVCALAAMRVASKCICGFQSQMKIVGGTETGIHEYPPMAGLFRNDTGELYCGASIISDRYALTAAHVLMRQTADNLYLVVGEHNVAVYNETAATDWIPIESFKSHPSYDYLTQHNDVAVVRTGRPIQFNMAVNPICLPFRYRGYNFLDESVTALGWGFQELAGDKSDVLLKVDLSVVSSQECDVFFTETIDSTQLCTYADGKDACLSDSGGPVVYKDAYTGKLEQVGIISFGYGCASKKPGVNTRVMAYLSWIASVTSDAAFCIQ